MGDNGYALDMLSPIRHVATLMDGAAPAALSIEEMAANYRHPNPSDLVRVRQHEACVNDDEAVVWLMERAVEAIRYRRKTARSGAQVEQVDGGYRLADDIGFEDLLYEGRKLERERDDHVQFRDPFNPMSGRFSENIRLGPDRDDLSELRESMREFGWIPQLRAIRDKRTGVVLAGHRRLKVAAELGIDPVYEDVRLGDGDEADAKRLAIAIASNIGAKPLTQENRKRIAEYLYGEREWTMARIAEALKVTAMTVSNDLREFKTTLNSGSKRGRPRNIAPEQETTLIRGYFDEGKTIDEAAREALGPDAPKGSDSSSVLKVIDQERGRREERERQAQAPEPEPPSAVTPMHACPHCGAMHPVIGS